MYRTLLWIGLGCSLVFHAVTNVNGQETFELSVPGLATPSMAVVGEHELVIRDAAGRVTRYQRMPRYDTADQQFAGYSSRQAQQVLRWPVSNQGKMQIGTLRGTNVQFAWSKMTISPSANAPQHVVPRNEELLPDGVEPPLNFENPLAPSNVNPSVEMTPVMLGVGDPGDRQFLSINGAGNLGFARNANSAASSWFVTPVANDMVRLQQLHQNNWHALGFHDLHAHRNPLPGGVLGGGSNVFPPGGAFGNAGFGGSSIAGSIPISLFPITNAADQLWRIHSPPGLGGGYYFESVLFPGMGLTMNPNNGLFLQPISYLPTQMWWPQTPTFPIPQPQFRTVNHQVIPNTPLPSIAAKIINTHSDAIVVLLVDRRTPQNIQKVRIPVGGSEMVRLDRDAGSTIIETVETLDTFGNWNQQQFKTPIPPAVLYDLSVYEEFLQSIAIDITGKSPNPIEDINYQPRSIGFFLLPPGAQLPEYAEIDAYRQAEAARNPGAVRRIDPRDLIQNKSAPNAPSDPLKDLLNKFQKQRAAF